MNDKNIYQTARELKGLTQEAAAERLDISVESISAYETGRRRPPDSTVLRMAQIYDFPYLCYQHLQSGDLACVLPELQPYPLQEAAMRLFRLVSRFARDQRTEKLLEIAEDGVIDEEELPVFREIMAELQAIVESVLSLGFCGHEKAPDRVGAQSGVGR